MLSTSIKLHIARLLYRVVGTTRSLLGLPLQIQAQRRGIKWSLDLREGIDLSLYLMGQFEPSTVRELSKHIQKGDTVLDIGANIGAHTLHLARSVGSEGRVHAFEPTEEAYQRLKTNLSLNPALAQRVVANQILLTDRPSGAIPSSIYASWPLDASSQASLHPKHRGKAMGTRHAVAERVDDYVVRQGLKQMQLVKLDVDGHEVPVLRGAERSLERFRPAIIMELSPYVQDEVQANGFDLLIELLQAYRYRLRFYGARHPVVLDARELRKRIPDGHSLNVILEHADSPTVK